MTYVGGNTRRLLLALLAFVLVIGVVSLVPTSHADAAYQGGNGWIAFENGFDLYAMPADGSAAPTNLTNTGPNFEADPVFSPDGTQIAFSRDLSGQANIWIADFDPSGPSLAAPATWTQVTNGDADGEPSWSGDGTEIAFERKIYFVVGGTATAGTATTMIDATKDFDALGVQPGRAAANVSDGSAGTITNVSGNTITVDALTGGTLNTWSPGDTYALDVAHIVVVKATIGGSPVAGTVLSADGVTPAYDDRGPAWSPTAGVIAFTTSRNGNTDVYTFTDTGSGALNLTPNPTFDIHASRPSWSPDGTHLAFQTAKPGNADSNIWTVEDDGANPLQITGASSTGTDGDVEPAWSPDGTQIAFRRADTGVSKTYVIASDGTGSATRIGTSDTPATHIEADWQPMLLGVADAYDVDEGAAISISAALGVLSNDLGLNSSVGTVAAVLVGDVSNGVLALAANGSFTYTHDDSETTSDSFTYQPVQGSLTGATTTVTITVNPVDEAPSAVADGYNVSNAATINVTAVDGVLSNDTDPEGLGLSAVLVGDVGHGTLALAANGSFTYTHDGSNTLADSFTYQAKDPGDNTSAVTTVSLTVGPLNPDPPVVTVSGPSYGAPGIMASFTSSITDGSGPVVYDWTITQNGTDVGQGTSASIDYTPAVTGLHTVTLVVADDAGTDTDTMDFTVMTDIGSSIFVGDILWLAEEGITRGCNPPTNDAFCPDDRVTRGQMATFLVRFLGLTDDGGGDLFTDDDTSIFEADIDKLATAGITKGCNAAGDQFCPEAFLTRGQMAAFLVRALGLTDDGGGDLFTDDDTSIFEADIDRLATAGVTKGCNAAGDQFCPEALVTRGQMAAFMHRADGLK